MAIDENLSHYLTEIGFDIQITVLSEGSGLALCVSKEGLQKAVENDSQ